MSRTRIYTVALAQAARIAELKAALASFARLGDDTTPYRDTGLSHDSYTTMKRTDRIILSGKYVNVVVENGTITELTIAGSPRYEGSRSEIGAAVVDTMITELQAVRETVFPEYVNASNLSMSVNLPKDPCPTRCRRGKSPCGPDCGCAP